MFIGVKKARSNVIREAMSQPLGFGCRNCWSCISHHIHSLGKKERILEILSRSSSFPLQFTAMIAVLSYKVINIENERKFKENGHEKQRR